MNNPVAQPMTLPSGTVLKNRLAKSAMNEEMADINGNISSEIANLYERWAKGGVGLLITGNVMVDREHKGSDFSNVLDDQTDTKMLKSWASAGKLNHTDMWMQLNHPGKQIAKSTQSKPVAPSSIGYEGLLAKVFNTPRELKESEILEIIDKFIYAAKKAKEAGFTGVQIHSAHGYLSSQFLSPLHNQRNDQWGGSIENRMRFLIEIYKGIRSAVGENFNVGVKLNSADFQKGGFTEDESMYVAKTLSDLGVDLLEISGGTYESPEMVLGSHVKESTRLREAYFIDYAAKVRKVVDMPLMVTGGFRSTAGMNEALQSGSLDVVGLARPLAFDPEFGNKILSNENAQSQVKPIKTGIKIVDNSGMLETAWYSLQMKKLAQGKDLKYNNRLRTVFSLAKFQIGAALKKGLKKH